MPTSPASEAISAKLPVSSSPLGLSESRSLIPVRMNEGGDEKQECDRQMSGSGWRLSVAFWFGLIGAGLRAGNLHCQWQEGKEGMTPGSSMEIRMDEDAALKSFRLG